MSLVTSLLKYMSLSENFLEPDDTVELFEGSTHTKGEWSREFHSICNKFILPQDAQKELLNLIFNTFGQTADLPVALTTSGKNVSKRNILILMIKEMSKKMKVVMTKVFPIPTLCLE